MSAIFKFIGRYTTVCGQISIIKKSFNFYLIQGFRPEPVYRRANALDKDYYLLFAKINRRLI